jgi:hypothetical protein
VQDSNTTESGKNSNQNNETESSKKEGNGKADSLLTMTSEAIQHVDRKKRSEG